MHTHNASQMRILFNGSQQLPRYPPAAPAYVCARHHYARHCARRVQTVMKSYVNPPPAAQVDLWAAVLRTYDSAQEKGAASSFQTQAHVRHDQGVKFVLRVVEALKKKPTAPQGDTNKQKEWRNPFLPYEEDLWVAHLSSTHTLLLNKFNVVPYHLLVVTRKFQSQQDPLNAADLDATLQVLRIMPQGGLAFYNCGPNSGRSQPHKHVQVVPLPLLEDQPAQPPAQVLWQAAAEQQQQKRTPLTHLQPFAVHNFPVQAYAAQLPATVDGQQLQTCTDALLNMAQHAAAAAAAVGSQQPAAEAFSYNVLLTREWVVVVPRSQEMAGPCAINALGFAGTILLKFPEQLKFVEQAGGPLSLLQQVGLPWQAGSSL